MNNEIMLHSIEVNDKVYFIQAAFTTDFSCDVTISDSVSSWQCNVTKSEIEIFAEETSTDLKEYYSLMKSAISGAPLTQVIEKPEKELTFEWKKVQKDVKFSLGTLTLDKVSDSSTAVKKILSSCCKSLQSFKSSLETSKLAHEKLLEENETLLSDLQKCVKLKENLESELLAKFVLVINEKKAKIRSLQKQMLDIAPLETVQQNTNAAKPISHNPQPQTPSSIPSTSKAVEVKLDDSLDGDTILPKRRRVQKKQPLTISVSPIKIKENHPVSPVKFPSDFTATSSDSTVDVNELIEEI